MYLWRSLTEEQRQALLRERRGRKLPWHSPPHFDKIGPATYIITASCYEHNPVIDLKPARLGLFENELLETCVKAKARAVAWCILPTHYHLLAHTERLKLLRTLLGQLHGRTARQWNLEDNATGRKVWFNLFDRVMRSERHYWASVNYVNNNAVHHGLVQKWRDWPYSSAERYLDDVGGDEVERIWREYPILDYGKGWDD